MIDRFLAFVGQRKQPIIGDHLKPVDAARQSFYHVENSLQLTVVFGYWHAPARSLGQVAQRLNARGSDVLLFDLNPGVLYQRPAFVRQSFETLAAAAVSRVGNLRKKYSYKTIDLLGFSLGNVPMCMTAQQLSVFHSATLVVPGSDLALCLWHGIRTRSLRDIFSANNIALEQLKREWRNLAPASHARAFKGHQTSIYLSKSDRFIPYRYGLELVSALENQGIHPHVQTTRRTGHALTIAKFIRSL